MRTNESRCAFSTILGLGLIGCLGFLVGNASDVSGKEPVSNSVPKPPVVDASQREAVEAAIQKVYPALVRIYVVTAEPDGGRMKRVKAAGSGAILSPDGFIVTNHHVAGNAVRIVCNLSNGEEIEAIRVGTDPMADICVLKLKMETRKQAGTSVPVAVWGDSETVKVGDVVLAMGCPMAVSQSVTQGIVSNTQLIQPQFMQGDFRLDGEDVGQIVRWIGHDAVIFGGNSGGPLVNLRGEIVGINEVGLGSLGGAIPANLAREIVEQIIQNGSVKRSWTGMEFQPRLKDDRREQGVLLAGVIARSPADKAGLQGGDLLLTYRGQPTNANLPEHIAPINQRIFSTPVGETVEITFERANEHRTTRLTTESLDSALGDPEEFKEWGMAVRDITRMMALERRRESIRGVLVDSVRDGGAGANAKMPLQSNDIIVQVNGQEIENAAALKKLTEQILKDKKKNQDRVPVLVQLDRKSKKLLTVVKIGKDEPKSNPAQNIKPWTSMATQVLLTDLAESLDLKGKTGVRVVEVFKDQAAEKAGVHVGDIILAVDGRKIEASQPQDSDLFDALIRKYPVGTEVSLEIVRDGKKIAVPMKLEAAPQGDSTAKPYVDLDFEFTARDLTYNDRILKQLGEKVQGVVLSKVEPGGWAALGGLQGDDLILQVNGNVVASAADLKSLMEQIRKEKPRRVSFFIQRGIHSRFCEIEPDYR